MPLFGRCPTCGQKTDNSMMEESTESRGFLEGAVMKAYCSWQYGIDPKMPRMAKTRRYLFYRDFNYDIQTQRGGEIVRLPKETSRGNAKPIIGAFTRYAEENGCPIPNPDLYKLWYDKYSMRFPKYWEFLEHLGLEVDAMPSPQTFRKLDDEAKVDYPRNDIGDPDFDIRN